MNLQHMICTAMLLATGLASAVSAQEIGGGRLAWILISEGVKQQFVPRAPAATVPGTQQLAPACEVVRWDRDVPGKPALTISHPGKYCLKQGHLSECPPPTQACTGYVIEIRASNVDLDLGGNIVRVAGTRERGGVWGIGRGIRIHNGHIAGGGVGVTLVDGGSSAEPADTGFVVEQMRFTDVLTAIKVAGSGNRVRDNHVDGARD